MLFTSRIVFFFFLFTVLPGHLSQCKSWQTTFFFQWNLSIVFLHFFGEKYLSVVLYQWIKDQSCVPDLPPSLNRAEVSVPVCGTLYGDKELQGREQSILLYCIYYDPPAGLVAGWQFKPQLGKIWGIWALPHLCVLIPAKCHGHVLVPMALTLAATGEEAIFTSLL